MNRRRISWHKRKDRMWRMCIISWTRSLLTMSNKQQNLIISQRACFVDICSWSTMTDGLVTWEPFTVTGSQSGEIMVINATILTTITVIPARLQMCVECTQTFFFHAHWMMTTLRHLSVPGNDSPSAELFCLESHNHNLSPSEPLNTTHVELGALFSCKYCR